MSRYNALREYTTKFENFKVIASGTLLALVGTEVKMVRAPLSVSVRRSAT